LAEGWTRVREPRVATGDPRVRGYAGGETGSGIRGRKNGCGSRKGNSPKIHIAGNKKKEVGQ